MAKLEPKILQIQKIMMINTNKQLPKKQSSTKFITIFDHTVVVVNL